jgi:hypothetical protein
MFISAPILASAPNESIIALRNRKEARAWSSLAAGSPPSGRELYVIIAELEVIR